MSSHHLYVIENRPDHTVVYFLTKRAGYFVPIVLMSGLCFGLIRTAIHRDWNGNVLSGIVGGSISMILITCFVMAEHIRLFTITIEPDVVSLQSTFQGIPVGAKKIYARSSITDLGMYPVEVGRDQLSSERCRLCIWTGGRSIQLENYFPISEGISLANDLRRIGIEFSRTQETYDKNRLAFATALDYFSF
jgi:hypothetical protein